MTQSSKTNLNVICWNINRNTLAKVKDIKDMLSTHNIDVMGVVESDLPVVAGKVPLTINGYSTLVPKHSSKGLARMIVLIKTATSHHNT